MVKERDLVNLLYQSSKPVKLSELVTFFGYSTNTVKKSISDLSCTCNRNGFKLVHSSHEGYSIEVSDNNKFQAFINKSELSLDYSRRDERVNLYLFILMQSTTHITIDNLVEKTGIGRTTIVSDLARVEEELLKFDLDIERKRKIGIKVIGEEHNIRKAFSYYVIDSRFNIEPVKDYFNFLNITNEKTLRSCIKSILLKNKIQVTEYAEKNILVHFQILLFRSYHNNYVKYFDDSASVLQPYISAAEDLLEYAKDNYNVEITDCERKYLALEIQSKAIVSDLPIEEKEILISQVKTVLDELYSEFGTDFKSDDELINNLILHIYPMIKRARYGFQLKNPMVDKIYMEYVNVFTISLRFCDLLRNIWQFPYITKDEVGFLSLHFANYFEKKKIYSIEKLKKVVLICSTGNSTSTLLKTKLESIFKNACVEMTTISDISVFDVNPPDLYLSTIPLKEDYLGVPIVHIKEFINDDELNRIRDISSWRITHKGLNTPSSEVLALFDKMFFQIIPSDDYLKIIENQAIEMEKMGKASIGFSQSVIEREKLCPTIFENGVATPHPMRLNALENCVGVTIFTDTAIWDKCEIKIVFLINLKADSFYFHQQLHQFVLKIIKDESIRMRLLASSNFEDFLFRIKNAV